MAESDTVGQIRQKLLPDGDASFLKVFRVFRKMLTGNIYKLTLEEFEQGLKNVGLSLEPEEVAAVFKEFDRDGSGALDMNEFFINLRPPMSEYRKQVLMEVFEKLDKTGDGVIALEDFDDDVNEQKINTTYYSGNEEPVESFLHFFKSPDEKDVKVTQEEFMHYYFGLSAVVASDKLFVETLESVWEVKVEVKKEED